MGLFAKGEVVLFPFPFTDLSGRKLRPCLVLGQQMGEDVLLCQITSQMISSDLYCVKLNKGLLKLDSLIRCNMLFTAHVNQIERSLGKIDLGVYENVVTKVVEVIT